MAITLKTIQCPKCGADLSIKEGRDKFFCSYCGSQIILANDNEHIFRHIDEAGIKQAETERILRIKEMEFKERENDKKRKSKAIAYFISLAIGIIGMFCCISDFMTGIIFILIAVNIALFTLLESSNDETDDKKKEPKPQLNPDEVMISRAMTFFYNEQFNGAVHIFKAAGFTNVNAVPLHDLSFFNKKLNGQIDKVTINGSNDFDEGDIFKKDANVLITYHSR